MKMGFSVNADRFGAIVLGLVSMAVAAPALQAQRPDPGSVHVENYHYAGLGCPAGSVSENLSQDHQALTLIFDQYAIEVGPRSSHGRAVDGKTCTTYLRMHIPNGWQMGLMSLDVRGYIAVERGIRGVQSSSYRFGESGPTTDLGTFVYNRPQTGDYTNSSSVPLNSVRWSACGAESQTLQVATALKLENGRSSSGFMSIDSQDHSFRRLIHHFGVTWRRCGGGGGGGDDLRECIAIGPHVTSREGNCDFQNGNIFCHPAGRVSQQECTSWSNNTVRTHACAIAERTGTVTYRTFWTESGRAPDMSNVLVDTWNERRCRL